MGQGWQASGEASLQLVKFLEIFLKVASRVLLLKHKHDHKNIRCESLVPEGFLFLTRWRPPKSLTSLTQPFIVDSSDFFCLIFLYSKHLPFFPFPTFSIFMHVQLTSIPHNPLVSSFFFLFYSILFLVTSLDVWPLPRLVTDLSKSHVFPLI